MYEKKHKREQKVTEQQLAKTAKQTNERANISKRPKNNKRRKQNKTKYAEINKNTQSNGRRLVGTTCFSVDH